MKYCEKCLKKIPVKITDNKEECMVCGNIIPDKQISEAKTHAKDIQRIKNFIKKDLNTGQYSNAQTTGRNFLIGFIIILAGIFYIWGGINMVLSATVVVITALVFMSIILFALAMVK